jgi:hypothetical protein
MRSKKLERIIFCHTFATANKLRWRVKRQSTTTRSLTYCHTNPTRNGRADLFLGTDLHGFINKDTAVINEKKAAFL